MSASHFGTTYWLDDYFGPYFQPEGQGGAIVGVLAGSAAGQATVAATLSSAQLSQSGVRRLGSYRAHTWNADRISAMLGSVRAKEKPRCFHRGFELCSAKFRNVGVVTSVALAGDAPFANSLSLLTGLGFRWRLRLCPPSEPDGQHVAAQEQGHPSGCEEVELGAFWTLGFSFLVNADFKKLFGESE